MITEQVQSADERWSGYGAEEYADGIVAAMKLGGVDNLFFTSGSEIAFYQESVAKANHRGWPAPRLLTVTHEGVTLNAALGNTMVSGKPAATAVHIDVGTFNYGGALHTAWRGPYPEQVGPALRRGLEQTRKGSPAIIAVWLPTLVEEMDLR